MEIENSSVNRHITTIITDYFRYSSRKELWCDVAIPITISIIVFLIVGWFSKSTGDIVKVFNDIITNALAVMAILAGFNTACLAVIASTSRETLHNLIDSVPEDDERDVSILKRIITFFSYAICSQILILIVGFIYIVVNNNFKDIYELIGFIGSDAAKILATVIGSILSACILHTLFVSLRNVSLLFRYILFVAETKD